LFVFTEFGGKYVVYNGTIQGGLFNDHVYVVDDINHWLLEMNTGIVLTRKNIGIEFSQYFLSPEVKKGGSHMFGNLTFRLAF
jgi:hypothetical protein